MADHTPTPWSYSHLQPKGYAVHAGNVTICHLPAREQTILDPMDEEAVANLKYIVRACNSHTQLVETLEAILIYAKSMEGGTMPAPVVAIRDTAHIALAKAREEA